MSKVPLLLRSSPAQGTGSYGALPVQMLSTSNESSADEGMHDLDHAIRSGKRKAASHLREADTIAEDEPESSKSVRSRFASTGRLLNRNKGSRRSRRKSLPNFNLPDEHPTAVEAWVGNLDEEMESDEDMHSDSGRSDSARSDNSEAIDIDGYEGSSEAGEGAQSKAPEESPSDDSPYPQVRAAVRPSDDTSLSINTPRMWALSMLFSILGSSTNLFFSLRYPSVSITPVIALLLVHPLGLLWDQLLKHPDDPAEVFTNGSIQHRAADSQEYGSSNGAIGLRDDDGDRNGEKSRSWARSIRLWLAQGRWNEKEHCCVYISSNVSFGFAFATDVIVEQSMFYNQKLTITYQILLTISTQVLGYALAGLTRRFLVRPSGMIWPGTLISTSMFSTLHKQDNAPANGWHISRMRFFLYIFLGSAAFYFLPGLLFPALSYFNVITWFAPKNVVVANLFGVASGLGLFPMTFDWSQIAYIGSPLVVPFWAALNIVGGLVVVMWFMAPIMYYMNVMYSSYMPILSAAVFDNTGKPYDVSKILTDNFLFDEKSYENYSRVFLPITYVLSYALQFAALTALLSHTACWHGKDILRQWKASWKEIKEQNEQPAYQQIPQEERSLRHKKSTRSMTASMPDLDNMMGAEDVHNRLMRRYKDAPMSWYLLTGVLMTAIGMFVVEYYPIHLPWYGLLLALGICTLLFIPIGIVMAITNQQSSLYLICQLICGVVFPGRPVANMVFVTYGYITSTQGLKFSSDLKLGHYMKIPPRILFTLQLAATLVSSLTQIGVLNWMLQNIPGICTPEAINGFNCPIARVHFNGSILWGVVGPARFFGPGALYRPLVWAFLLGAVAPVGVWLLGRRQKHSIWRKVNLPVLFGSLSWIPPATGLNFSVWAVVCWLFNDFIRTRHSAWWKKYTMTLSAALDSGVAVGVVIVFFGVIYPGFNKGFSWWGTEVFKQGCDWHACSYKTVEPGDYFGPDTW
ncbi:putative oligopeptide transporter [Diplodia seriata]|uniref:Putative oligopeptide transporter n=1 Tax=Diplodia seriata TaxID=420778 RepID=A0A1S8B639_9PEZI|nr:putative oligopeptide transporter [Diplodia seriata]